MAPFFRGLFLSLDGMRRVEALRWGVSGHGNFVCKRAFYPRRLRSFAFLSCRASRVFRDLVHLRKIDGRCEAGLGPQPVPQGGRVQDLLQQDELGASGRHRCGKPDGVYRHGSFDRGNLPICGNCVQPNGGGEFSLQGGCLSPGTFLI